MDVTPMANCSFNHLWLIGPAQRAQRWTDRNEWAGLYKSAWTGFFHPDHGYAVGCAGVLVTNRGPVSVFDQERRPGIEHDVDQFLVDLDEGWESAGYAWRTAQGTSQPRVSIDLKGQPSSRLPSDVWVLDQHRRFLPEALASMRRVPLPVAATSLPLVVRRALWRDDAHAVNELLAHPTTRPKNDQAWWDGVHEASLRSIPWVYQGSSFDGRAPHVQATGVAGEALHAWLSAMPAALRDEERLHQALATTDPAVRTAARAWLPVDAVWSFAGLNLPCPGINGQMDLVPCAERAFDALWNASSPEMQQGLAVRWLDNLVHDGEGPHDEGPELFEKMAPFVARMERWSSAKQPSMFVNPRIMERWREGNWWPLLQWAETRALRDVLPMQKALPSASKRSRL